MAIFGRDAGRDVAAKIPGRGQRYGVVRTGRRRRGDPARHRGRHPASGFRSSLSRGGQPTKQIERLKKRGSKEWGSDMSHRQIEESLNADRHSDRKDIEAGKQP